MQLLSGKQNRLKARKSAAPKGPQVQREWGRILNRLVLIAVVIAFVYGVEQLGRQLDAIPVDRVVFAGDLQHVSRDVLVDRVTGHLAVGYVGLDLEAIKVN